MDATVALVAALRALAESQALVDELKTRVIELEQVGQQQLADVQAKMAALETESLPLGWRLVKEG